MGTGLCGGNVVSLLLLVVPIPLAFLRRIAIKEAALVSALGPDHLDYASRTGRLVPYVH